MSSPKEFHIDAVYPVPLSRLHRGTSGLGGISSTSELPSSAAYRRAVKKPMHRGGKGRFRTQPVTFQEIQEVDEETVPEVTIEPEICRGSVSATSACRSESDLKANFELFYRSIAAHNNDNTTCVNATQSSSNICKDGISQFSPTSDSQMSFRREASPSTKGATAPLDIPFNPKSRPSL